jgi:hypothetical protein
LCHDRLVNQSDALNGLSRDQRDWALQSAKLWEQAYALTQSHPEHDPSDVFHALRCLELSPAERLRNGLSRGRLRAYAR